jgi:hypothetical protein
MEAGLLTVFANSSSSFFMSAFSAVTKDISPSGFVCASHVAGMANRHGSFS